MIVVDLLRIFTIAGALWIIVLLARLHATHALPGSDRQRTAQLLTDLSYSLALIVVIVRRAQHFGDPPTGLTWFTAGIVLVGAVGIGYRFRFRRRRARR